MGEKRADCGERMNVREEKKKPRIQSNERAGYFWPKVQVLVSRSSTTMLSCCSTAATAETRIDVEGPAMMAATAVDGLGGVARASS